MTTLTNQPRVSFTPARRVAGVRPYESPSRPAWIDLPLDANEGPASRRGLEAVAALGADALRRYPSAAALESRLAERWGVAPERVVVTAGGDDAIDRICRACLEPGRALVTHAPSFEMIVRSARLAGAETRTVDWIDGPFPARTMERLIGDDAGLVALVTPNNPTGAEIDSSGAIRLADAAAARGAMAMLDAAYGDFTDRDVTADLLSHPAVFVVRTFSKAYGLAGLRVGYAIAPSAEAASWLRAAGGPYPTAGASLAAAGSALEGPETERFVRRIREERTELTALLETLGARPIQSGANFVLARFANASFVRSALASVGVAVRGFEGGPMQDALRITLPGEPRDLARLARALRSAVAPEAVLFDLDGVIADVTGSYRAAIVETARSFGAAATLEDVARVKAEGDANNDWIVTRRLIERARGSAAALEEVVDRFQSLYLGRDGRDGLRERERLLVEAEPLRRLAARTKAAIVTGRPRAEVSWFLERFGLREAFRVVVAQEDAPAKPDPAGVRLALERLGAATAWMIGDTVDDLRAARAAGVVSIGVAATETERAVLDRAGAAWVVPNAGEIPEMIR